MPEWTRRDVLRFGTSGSLLFGPLSALQTAAFCDRPTIEWHAFPDLQGRIAVHGLPFFPQYATYSLYRLPAHATSPPVPGSVFNSMKFPAGGRLRFRSNTQHLAIEVRTSNGADAQPNMSLIGSHGMNVYVDGDNWGSMLVSTSACTGTANPAIDSVEPPIEREFTIYLPLLREVVVTRIGLSQGASLSAPGPFSETRSLMVYGSSIAQGIGACRAGMSYEAILARRLQCDFTNFGFSGAGKGESSVISLITEVVPPPHCLIIDVGLSFHAGNDDPQRYMNMLDGFRQVFTDTMTHIVCAQPILGPARHIDQNRYEQQIAVAAAAAQAVQYRCNTHHDMHTYLVNGNVTLLNPTQRADCFHDFLHPNDLGYSEIAINWVTQLQSLGIYS